MIGKCEKNFEHNAKNFAGKFLIVTEKSSKTEVISLSYDVNPVYSKSIYFEQI